MLILSLGAAEPGTSTTAIGTRLEILVDDWLIDVSQTRGDISLRLQPPVKREVVLVTDKPWEGPDSASFTVFQDWRANPLRWIVTLRGI